MDQDVSLYTFPATKEEALTMLYLQKQDLSDKSPEDLIEMYYNTLEKIKAQNREIRNRIKNR